MEVGTEISQKIRSAIKAKLIELGAYVDDELPDYIMVMVANKKSREQMISDLNLFLGKNTDTFAEWLHGLLGKLQTISVDSNAVKSVKEKKKTDSKKDKKVKKSNKNESSSQGKKVKSKKGETVESKSDKTVELKSKGSSDTAEKTKHHKESSHNEEKETSQSETVEDVRQMLVTVAPTDELAAELETTEARIQQSQQVASETGKYLRSESTKDARDDSHTTERRKRSSSPGSERHIQSSSAPKKHRGLTSVVASVSKDEEEEEYDPLCPAVGSVASVVKVTSRKSKVPPALQANSDMMDHCGSETRGTEIGEKTGKNDNHSNISEVGSIMVQLNQTASMDRIRTALREVLIQSREESNNDRDDVAMFCQSVASCLRKMNQRNLAIAKLRIQKILFDYESSLQAGGNNRWTAASSNSNSSGTEVNNSNLQISSSGGNRSAPSTSSRQQLSINTNHTGSSNTLTPIDSDESINLQSKLRSANASSLTGSTGLESPSSVSHSSTSMPMPKSDNSLVTSSCKNDRLSPFRHRHDPHTNASDISLSSSQSELQSSMSHNSPSQPISLDSLHLKRRSELESSTSSGKNSNSILRFRPLLHSTQTGISGDNNNQNSGTDSPKPLSAEQLKVLAKNLKITISNSRGKSSDDESESSSEGSDDETDSDDDEEEEEEGNKKCAAEENDSKVTEDLREFENKNSVERRKQVLETNTTGSITNCSKESESHDRNDSA